MVEPREWLIRKDGYFYRPNCAGYTTSKFEAGRYTKSEAEREAAVEPWHMKAIHQDDVEDDPVSSRVRMDGEKIAALKDENERLTRERDHHSDLREQYLAEAERALAERAGGVKVKALEWYEAKALGGGRKSVAQDCFGNEFARIDLTYHTAIEVEEFKAERERDYERRILSALEQAAPAFEHNATNDQIAAVMLQHGNEDQRREALAYAGIAAPEGQQEAVSLPPYGKMPFDELGRDVSEAGIGVRRDFDFGETYPGHVMTGINFNSLNRIVSKYATRPSEQAVTADWQRVDDALVSCAGLLKTLCRNEIGETAAAELEYVRFALKAAMEAGRHG